MWGTNGGRECCHVRCWVRIRTNSAQNRENGKYFGFNSEKISILSCTIFDTFFLALFTAVNRNTK